MKKILDKIEDVQVDKVKLFGLVFIYPEEVDFTNGLNVQMSHQFCEVPIDMKNFIQKITDYLDVMHQDQPPPPPENCNKCLMHKYFYDENKLQ